MKEVCYKIRKYRQSKAIRIKISANGNVLVTAPLRTSDTKCKNFVQMHIEWIQKTIQKVKSQQDDVLQFCQDMSGFALYLGRKITIKIDTNIKSKYILEDEILTLKKDDLHSFYRDEARRIIESKCAEIAPFYGVSYKKIRIGTPKTRWGSYSTSGTLSFNQNLIKAPKSIIEYVVIHELCHILVPNHSKNYWVEVTKLCPDFKTKRAWLRKNQTLLST